MYKLVSTVASSVFDLILFILAGNQGYHKSTDEFEFRPDRTPDSGVSCPLSSGKIPIDLQLEKCCDHTIVPSFLN